MKKITLIVLFCSVFVLGCNNAKEEMDDVAFEDVVVEENNQQGNENSNEDINPVDEVQKLSEEGMREYQESNFDRAKELYTKAIQLNGNRADLYADRGRVKRDLGDLEGAIEDVNKALEISQEGWIYAERAVAYQIIGEDAKALQDLKKALSIDPNMDWVKEAIKELENK